MKAEPVFKKIKISNEREDSSSDIDDPDEIESADEIDVKEIEEKKSVIKNNPENVNANFFNEELTSDDEILTFQCPENFDMNLLLNESLSLSKAKTIGEDEMKYNCYVLPNSKKQLTCVLPSKKGNAAIVNLPVAGHIVIKKEFKFPKTEVCSDEDDGDDEDNETDSDSESENEVERHPLLGKDYKEHLKIVMQHMRKHKKLLKKSIKQVKNLEKAEKERKEQKKKLKVQLSLLKKTLEVNDS